MIADSERREAAERLRRLQSRQFRDEERPEVTTWEGIGAAVLPDDVWQRIDRLRSRDNRTQSVRSVIAGRLADLIETEPERTCRVKSSREVGGDGCYAYFEYELSCGHEIAWGDQLPPSYCPECGAKVMDE